MDAHRDPRATAVVNGWIVRNDEVMLKFQGNLTHLMMLTM
jgi:hypothetical protein